MSFLRSLYRPSILALVFVSTACLTACGDAGTTNANVFGTSNAQVRFLNGSAAAGSVDVVIDGTVKFAATAPNTVTNYLSVGTGTHSVTVYPANNDTQSAAIISNQTFHVNSANYETLALAGTAPATFYSFSDQVFSGSYSGNGAVNFYNASPTSGLAGIQFGYYTNPQAASSSPTITALGSALAPGNESGPISIPTSVAIGFGAANSGTTTAIATLKPSQIDPSGCAANTFSCNSGLVSIFLTDGPTLVGIFNASGQ